MTAPLRVALISHDARKQDMREWAEWNRAFLSRTRIWATHHTGELVPHATGLQPHMLKSGPLGGDAQVAAMGADAELDLVRDFWQPPGTQPHAAEVRTVIRLAVLHA